jgi:hypothetical protein
MLSMTAPEEVEAGLTRLRADIDSGAWSRQHRDLEQLEELDLGYRMLTAYL